MLSSTHTNTPPLVRTLRWGARVVSAVILGFFGFFFFAHLVGDAGAPSRALVWQDYASLTLLVASVLGLGVAMKWERLGASITLLCVVAGALLNWRVLMFPATLIPIAAVLYLSVCTWEMWNRPRHATAERSRAKWS